MASTPSALPYTPHDPSQSEEGRAFYQARIAFLNLVLFLISGSFLLLASLANLFAPSFEWDVNVLRANLLHVTATVVAGGIWLWARRGERSPRALVQGADLGGTTVQALAYSGMAALAPRASYNRMDLIASLTLFAVLTTRAVIVPSAASQTAKVGLFFTVPVLCAAYDIGGYYEPLIQGARLYAIVYNLLWCVVAVIITTLASRVIYGLRHRAERAEKLGQYLLEEKIGQGGMGTVYRAQHALLRRPTAIKLLPMERAGAQSLARFEREVQLTSRLSHPNTVAIFDYGRTPEGVFYYAMEYLDGLDLERLVELDGPQPPERVAHILRQVCGALAEAHALGLVHRDIKPANIILCERGGAPDVAKVVDFGLVKELEVQGGELDGNATKATTILGTPLYLSPEGIADPASVGAASDLYALGAVGYFLLTGTPPFQARTVVEVCGMHLHQAPQPPSERLGRAIPVELEQSLLACLRKAPGERPAGARALRDSLDVASLVWTEAQARAWWERVGPARNRQSNEQRRSAHGTTVLAVDLSQRVEPA